MYAAAFAHTQSSATLMPSNDREAGGTMPSVYVSYSRNDREQMEQIVENLRRSGFDIWIDIQKDSPNQSWQRLVKSALEGCDSLIVLASPSAKRSEWVKREIEIARDLRKTMVPVLITGERETAIPADLLGYEFVDMLKRRNQNVAYANIVQTLEAKLNITAPSKQFDPTARAQIDSKYGAVNTKGNNWGTIYLLQGQSQNAGISPSILIAVLVIVALAVIGLIVALLLL